MGHGRQYVSWLHEIDFCRAVSWLIENQSADGIYNLTAPEPLTNREMMRILREANDRRLGLPATKLMLEVGAFLLRTETELILKSRRVVPERLLDEGFEFRFAEMKDAVDALEEALA